MSAHSPFHRIRQLAERYATPLPQLETEVDALVAYPAFLTNTDEARNR